MSDKIKFIEDSSNPLDDEQRKTIEEICKDLIPDPLKEEDMQDTEKAIADELQIEYKDGCFKVQFGNIASSKPPGEYYYHFKCECLEDGDAIDLLIGYDL